MRVQVVTGEPSGALARAVVDRLGRAGHAPAVVGPRLGDAEGVLVFVDDAGLPIALPRLIQLQPGRKIFAGAILAVERTEGAGGLVGEGFRDVVAPADAPQAVEAIVRGRPPVVLQALRREVEGTHLPAIVAELRQQAADREALVRDCIDLVRAAGQLRKRIFRLGKRYEEQALDELFLLEARAGDFIAALDERRGQRPGKLPAFPPPPAPGSVLGRHEPRFRGAREEVDDAIDWLRQAGFLRALGAQGLEEMTRTATTLADRPRQALRDCLNIVESEIALRLSQLERQKAQATAMGLLEERCFARSGFEVLPPGIAVPATLGLVLRSALQPPPETYLSWCLDLRDLRIKQCGEVLDHVQVRER